MHDLGKGAAFAWFLLSFIFSQIILPIIHKREVYPFFTWNLFSNPSMTETDYLIRVDSWKGMKLENPCFLQDCPFIRMIAIKDTGPQGMVLDFAKALKKKSPEAQLRKKDIETYLLGNEKCTYSLIKRKSQPLKYILGEMPPLYELVSTFEK